MRHHLSGRQLSRNSSHRHALMRNMATSLLRHEAIRTTLPKAKELRRVVEPLITLAKSDSLTSRRRAFDQLRDNAVVEKLFVELGPRYQARPGGYTRILRMFPRPGDAAPMALMELVDRPEAAALAEDEAQTAKDAKKDAKKAKAEKAVAPEAKAEEKAKRKAKKAEAIAAAKAAEAEEAAKPAKKKKTVKKKAAARPAAKSGKKKR